MATTADGALVEAARAGDQRAFGQLFDAWFDRVHDVSRRIVHDDGIAGEVAQDTFLRAWTKLDTLDDVDAFGGWVLRIGRNASLNRLEKERRSTVLDDETMTAVTDAGAPDHDPLARMDQAARIALVWDAAAALGERDASVLDLHLRHGLSAAELAEELGTNANNAHQMLFTLRKRLGNAVRALVLWRAGHPTCADLRESLADAGLTSFGAPMVKAIDRHVDRCDTCAEDRTERLSPAALFAAAPIVAAPTLLKAEAAAGLEAAGVPMGGSGSASAPAVVMVVVVVAGAVVMGRSASSPADGPGPPSRARRRPSVGCSWPPPCWSCCRWGSRCGRRQAPATRRRSRAGPSPRRFPVAPSRPGRPRRAPRRRSRPPRPDRPDRAPSWVLPRPPSPSMLRPPLDRARSRRGHRRHPPLLHPLDPPPPHLRRRPHDHRLPPRPSPCRSSTGSGPRPPPPSAEEASSGPWSGRPRGPTW